MHHVLLVFDHIKKQKQIASTWGRASFDIAWEEMKAEVVKSLIDSSGFDDSLIICPLPRVKVAAAKWQKRRPYLQPIRAGGNCCHSIVADKNNDPISLFASLHTPLFFLLLLRLLPWRKIALGPKHWGAIEVLGLKLWIAYNNDMSSRFAFWNKYIEK